MLLMELENGMLRVSEKVRECFRRGCSRVLELCSENFREWGVEKVSEYNSVNA